mgnify:CR=1 FL=1
MGNQSDPLPVSQVELADRLAIADQLARYSYTADARDLDAFMALFTEDAVWQNFVPGKSEPDIKLRSRAEIRAFSAALWKESPGLRSGHHQSGLLFTELTRDSARTKNMILISHQGPGDQPMRIATFGYYETEWRKTPDGWLIASRTYYGGHRTPASYNEVSA